MTNYKEDYDSLISQYEDNNSLMQKKIKIVDEYISGGHSLLDIGSGTGELINLEYPKFEHIWGIDGDERSIDFLRERFREINHVNVIYGNIIKIDSIIVDKKFDYITCLDVLEHIEFSQTLKLLNSVYKMLSASGILIVTVPGMFEKIRICLGRSPAHIHSHSSYGWARILMACNYHIINIETVEFPIIHSNMLRKRIHALGKCCVIIAKRKAQETK